MHKINSAKFLEPINNRSIINQFLHRGLPVFPLILTETLVEYPLIQLPFLWETEIYKLEIFKNLPFSKISTHEIQ